MAEVEAVGPSEAPVLSFEERVESLLTPADPSRGSAIGPELAPLARAATMPHNINSPKLLEGILERGNNLFMEGRVTPEQWGPLAAVIADQIEELKPSEAGVVETLAELAEGVKTTAEATRRMAEATAIVERFPEEEAEQREAVLRLLEKIEANDLPLTDYRNTMIAGALSHLIDQGLMAPELAEECRARLNLQHCAALVGNLPGKDEKAVEYLFAMFESAESRKYALEAEDLHRLLKEGLPGLGIRKAFGVLQDAAMEGFEVDVGEGGEEELKTIRFMGPNTGAEEGKLKREIMRRITEETGLDAKAAAKSFQLALRVARATFETSVWNKNLLGSDPLAECIYFRQYREGRAKKGRDRGPDITIPRIEGFSTSFFRSYLWKVKMDRLARAPRPAKRLAALKKVRCERRLDIDKIDFSKLKAEAYMVYAIDMARALGAKGLLLKSTWLPKEFTSDAVEGWVAPFNAADPEEVYRLKNEFIVGALWSVYSYTSGATAGGWDRWALGRTKEALTHSFTPPEGGREAAFINEAQWDWATKVIKDKSGIDVNKAAVAIGVYMAWTDRLKIARG